MSFISVFDVMGPNMIGPSSSHTAGAARIAFLAQKMITPPLKKVEFILYGSFARTYKGHGTDRALLTRMEKMEMKYIEGKAYTLIAYSKALRCKVRLVIWQMPNVKKKLFFSTDTSLSGEEVLLY